MQQTNKMAKKNLRIVETWPTDTPHTGQLLENGLRLLAKMIVKIVLEETSVADKASGKPTGNTGTVSSAGADASPQEKLTLAVTQAAELLGLSRASAYDAVNRGQIPSIRMGRRILIPKAALIRMINEADKEA